MSLILNNTTINQEPLVALAASLSHDREAFLQLLLEMSKKTAFNRIVNCPTYPIRIVTQDLGERTNLFNKSISSDPYDICYALAFLYEHAAETELRKNQGQFFTPAYVARKATAKLYLKYGENILDPGCGTGIFGLTIIKKLARKSIDPASVSYVGIENDPLLALCTAFALDWVDAPKSWQVLYANFLSVQIDEIKSIIGKERNINAVISNPPYVRYHKLGERTELAIKLRLPRLSGLHSFFLEYSSKLAKNSRMVFIVPLEMNATRYGKSQLERLRNSFNVESYITYYNKIKNIWRTLEPHKITLAMHSVIRGAWNLVSFHPISEKKLESPFTKENVKKHNPMLIFNAFASVRRGISTGANSYFVLTDNSAKALGILDNMTYLKKIVPTKISKARLGTVFDEENWQSLKEEGKPCWLLSLPDKIPIDNLPNDIRHYLREGERQGVHLIPTCKNRKPWYYIKIPEAPNLFFTYVSRGFPAFVYNKARVHNLTNLLGIYLKMTMDLLDYPMEKLTELLNIELTNWLNLGQVGRRYQGGLIKFEPRDLENMPLTAAPLKNARICINTYLQVNLTHGNYLK